MGELKLSYRQIMTPVIQKHWADIPLKIKKDDDFFSIFQYVETIAEMTEMHWQALSAHYSYRQIRAAVYLMVSATVYLLDYDLPLNLYELAKRVEEIAAEPPLYDMESGEEERYESLYWSSEAFSENIATSCEAVMYMLGDYSLEWLDRE